MRIAGVVAEYNPFHNGHLFHLQKTRENGADAVVAVMSGNFVQRGEAAILDKWARAEAAAKSGVDLVLELPVYWATGGAQMFASGAVSVLRHLGCVDMLSFGSECGDISHICQAAEAVEKPETAFHMQTLLQTGMPFAAARTQAIRTFCPEAAEVLQNPNDTLAVEYCLAAKRCGAEFLLSAVKRIGAAHDSDFAQAQFASASKVRECLLCGTDYAPYCPPETVRLLQAACADGTAPASLKTLERMLLAKLRTTSPQQIAALPDVSEGLENRIPDAARQAHDLESLYALCKTKRYPLSRIRRILLSFLLDIRAADIPADVPYIRVLAIGERGAEILHHAKRTADLPVYTKMAGVTDSVFEAECRASEIYGLLTPKVLPAGAEWTKQIYVQK